MGSTAADHEICFRNTFFTASVYEWHLPSTLSLAAPRSSSTKPIHQTSLCTLPAHHELDCCTGYRDRALVEFNSTNFYFKNPPTPKVPRCDGLGTIESNEYSSVVQLQLGGWPRSPGTAAQKRFPTDNLQVFHIGTPNSHFRPYMSATWAQLGVNFGSDLGPSWAL